jgi:hypothetical protein
MLRMRGVGKKAKGALYLQQHEHLRHPSLRKGVQHRGVVRQHTTQPTPGAGGSVVGEQLYKERRSL